MTCTCGLPYTDADPCPSCGRQTYGSMRALNRQAKEPVEAQGEDVGDGARLLALVLTLGLGGS